MALLLHAISRIELTTTQHEQLRELGLSCYSHPPLNGLATSCTVVDVEAASRDHLMAYSDLIEAARAVADIIPMRYGAIFDNAHQLKQTLERNQNHFAQQLQEISGCVEMSIRVPINPSVTQVSEPVSGREYLKAKQQQANSWQVALQVITESVTGCYVKRKAHYVSSTSLLYVYFLVRNAQLDHFGTSIRSLQLPQLSLSGPWAAYNFVNE
ncbi:GvpL/GvpF family gas vesicle protein [Spartinivicinus ruber]|uniref:GvpL/GvpF family gas vesicle protein n=1 Tax=Spartinivicinus ruber TaxID=2683272 RepID=UPI0013D0DB88|nr:GvpL/GvpF family gas vesicle protein [Spartinivicinus ruber]